MDIDPGFIYALRRHVEEDGPAVRAIAEAAEPALWDRLRPPTALCASGGLHAARERSLAQAREFLLESTEPL